MTEKKIPNRWFIVFGALMIQICIGTVFIWSLFKGPLMEQWGWAAAPTSFTFSIMVFFFAASTILAGKIQDRIGPRWVATVGGLLYGLGLILASQVTSMGMLWLTYGVIGGIGIGTAYVCPLATCIKWFPDKKGLISGVALAGFGLGGMVFTPIAKMLMGYVGLMNSFAYLGLIYAIFVVMGAQILKNPPPNWMAEIINTSPSSGRNSYDFSKDYEWGEMLRTPQFYIICILFIFGTASGFMIIANALPIAVIQGLDASIASLAVMIVALFNAAGRVIWGGASDRLGRTQTLMIIFLICGLTMFSLKLMTGLIILIGISLIGFCFGGFLAVFPSLSADYYGLRNYGVNYGTIFVAYGIGAIVGPMLYDLMKSSEIGQISTVPLIIGGSLNLIGLGLTLLLKPPRPNHELSK